MENGMTIYWVQFYRQDTKFEAHTLLPQGLYFKVGTFAEFPSSCFSLCMLR